MFHFEEIISGRCDTRQNLIRVQLGSSVGRGWCRGKVAGKEESGGIRGGMNPGSIIMNK